VSQGEIELSEDQPNNDAGSQGKIEQSEDQPNNDAGSQEVEPSESLCSRCLKGFSMILLPCMFCWGGIFMGIVMLYLAWKALDSDEEHKFDVEAPPPKFNRLHFMQILFPEWPNSEQQQEWKEQLDASNDESAKKLYEEYAKFDSPKAFLKDDDTSAKLKDFFHTQMAMFCEAKYETWCNEVLQDLEDNAEFNSEAQMDRFKSRMLRGMEKVETLSASSSKIDRMQEQIKALSDIVQSQHAQVQLILQKLNSD